MTPAVSIGSGNAPAGRTLALAARSIARLASSDGLAAMASVVSRARSGSLAGVSCAPSREERKMSRRIIGSIVLILVVLGSGAALGARKYSSLRAAEASAAQQPEPMETISVAAAAAREHRAGVTSIGTVLATRSVVLRNELAGTVSEVALSPGRIVAAGTVLVALDVSVEQADLVAQQAQAQLAQTILDRNQQASEGNAVSQIEVDRARTGGDEAQHPIERGEAAVLAARHVGAESSRAARTPYPPPS